ncbi:MAG: heavy metal translocating P-type ATPase [Planctomycetaceae bacterium]
MQKANGLPSAERASFHVDGLDCAEEVSLLKQELADRPGIHELDFDVLNARMNVQFDAAITSTADIVRHVAATGMTARLWQRTIQSQTAFDWHGHVRLILTCASGVLMTAGLAWHALVSGSLWAALGHAELGATQTVPLLSRLLYTASILCGLRYVAPKAWGALLRRRADMNLLMSIAVVGAIVINQWFEAAVVTFLFALSLLLEHWSMGRARRAIAALMNLTPPTARCKSPHGNRLEDVPVADVAVAAVMVVHPGERVPLDGRVLQGNTSVDEAPITGESNPVSKQPGDAVFAGTINQTGVIEVEVTRPAGESLLSRILHMVSEAQSRRAMSEQWIEQFARYYTPTMMALALAVAIVPPLVFDAGWSQWVYNGLVVLVIACPCALVISTPVSIVSGLTSAARHGVLIKGGRYLEAAGTLKAIAFDKTGTLTRGEPVVHEIVTFDGYPQQELLRLAAALESQSSHPLARAIVRHAQQLGIDVAPAADLRTLNGLGARGRINGEAWWIGNRRLLDQQGLSSDRVDEVASRIEGKGYTVVAVGDEHRVIGLIAIADGLRPEAREAVDRLRKAGLRHVVMLTGDNRTTAERIARESGINQVFAELLPQDKVREVEALRQRYGTVAMVGDGINDAPALAASTVGIAMGAVGTDAAIETADVALMSDDLLKVPWLISHARRTLAIIRQNVVFALGLKLLFIGLTLAGLASLWLAIAADTGASLLVIFNGLRLLKK